MTKQKLKDKIAKIEKNLKNPNISDTSKAIMQKGLDAAKNKLAEMEKEEKPAKKEKVEKKPERKHGVIVPDNGDGVIINEARIGIHQFNSIEVVVHSVVRDSNIITILHK